MYPIDDQIRVYPLENQASKAVGVPRRFGVGGMLILVTMCAVLFAVLSSLDTPPQVFAAVAVLFVSVIAGPDSSTKGCSAACGDSTTPSCP